MILRSHEFGATIDPFAITGNDLVGESLKRMRSTPIGKTRVGELITHGGDMEERLAQMQAEITRLKEHTK